MSRSEGAAWSKVQQDKAASGPTGQSKTYSAAFLAEVDARFNEWSTQLYAGSSGRLMEIGATRRQEERDRIRDSLEREWLAQGRVVFEIGEQGHDWGQGQRLGGSESRAR